MREVKLSLCVCMMAAFAVCAGVMVNGPLVLQTAEFNCSEDLFQVDIP
jgi:hypothetical protein